MKVLHWNVLADCNADTSPQGFPCVKPDILKWSYRFPKIIAMIQAENPDLISLVEVDQPEDFRVAFVDEYMVFYEPPMYTRTGSILMVRKTLITGIPLLERITLPGKKFAHVVTFVRPNGYPLVFANCHLKAKPAFSRERVEQVEALQQALEKLHLPRIVAGDFNDTPTSECMTEMLRTYHLTVPENLISTCKIHSPEEGLIRRRIDYILEMGWNRKGSIPGLETVKVPEEGLPCADFPSDHFYLVTEFGKE